MGPRPERLAAAARMLQPALLESMALRADLISDELAMGLGLVAWDRQRLIGQAQQRILRLRERRFGRPGGDGVRILERRLQPLECIELAWSHLRQGRRVHVEAEVGASSQVLALLTSMGILLGDGSLTVASPGASTLAAYLGWPRVGVEIARRRTALVQEDGDPELAAYVLARACLRRTGFDPRAVHQVIVVGAMARLERTLRHLWLGATMGPTDGERAFAGPVTEAEAEAFFAAERLWEVHPGVEMLCPGGRLEHAGASRGRDAFLAPALFRLPAFGGEDSLEVAPGGGEAPVASRPPIVGPMLVIHPVIDPRRAEALFDRLSPPGELRLRVGEPPRGLCPGPYDRQFRGALLVERLPPGLPDPRP